MARPVHTDVMGDGGMLHVPRLAGPLRFEAERWVSTMVSEQTKARIQHDLDARFGRFGVWLYRVTRGRIVRPWGRRVLVLTTRGRRTGLARSVLLQYFPDGADRIVVAANSGRPTHPAWYHNLTATPAATVEVDGHRLLVRAVELTDAEAKQWWPRVVAIAPSYARIPERTTRRIPLIRLVAAN